MEEIIKSIKNYNENEPSSFRCLHHKFNPDSHNPTIWVNEKIEIAKKKKYTEVEIVHAINETLPEQFGWRR